MIYTLPLTDSRITARRVTARRAAVAAVNQYGCREAGSWLLEWMGVLLKRVGGRICRWGVAAGIKIGAKMGKRPVISPSSALARLFNISD